MKIEKNEQRKEKEDGKEHSTGTLHRTTYITLDECGELACRKMVLNPPLLVLKARHPALFVSNKLI